CERAQRQVLPVGRVKFRKDVDKLRHDAASMLFAGSPSPPGGGDVSSDVLTNEKWISEAFASLGIADKSGHRSAGICDRLQCVNLRQHQVRREQTVRRPPPKT